MNWRLKLTTCCVTSRLVLTCVPDQLPVTLTTQTAVTILPSIQYI
jgi:hypothetical protein